MIDLVFAFAGTIESSGDLYLIVLDRKDPVRVIQCHGDFSEIHGTLGLRTIKDDVFHLRATERFNALLAKDPADRVRNVTLTASVRTDDSRHSPVKLNKSVFRE